MLQRFPIISRIFLSAAITAGTLGLAEWALSDNDWSALYAGDPGGMWWLKGDLDLPAVPHIEEGTHFAVKTNAIGLRDGLMPVASPWVLALGCSTTFGWGVEAEEAWPAVLEQELGVPVVNGGIPGHSTEQGLVIAPKLLVHKPDVVIFGWGLRDAQRTTVADADRGPPVSGKRPCTRPCVGSCSHPSSRRVPFRGSPRTALSRTSDSWSPSRRSLAQRCSSST